jgi:hypothetical protein
MSIPFDTIVDVTLDAKSFHRQPPSSSPSATWGVGSTASSGVSPPSSSAAVTIRLSRPPSFFFWAPFMSRSWQSCDDWTEGRQGTLASSHCLRGDFDPLSVFTYILNDELRSLREPIPPTLQHANRLRRCEGGRGNTPSIVDHLACSRLRHHPRFYTPPSTTAMSTYSSSAWPDVQDSLFLSRANSRPQATPPNPTPSFGAPQPHFSLQDVGSLQAIDAAPSWPQLGQQSGMNPSSANHTFGFEPQTPEPDRRSRARALGVDRTLFNHTPLLPPTGRGEQRGYHYRKHFLAQDLTSIVEGPQESSADRLAAYGASSPIWQQH